MVHMDPFNEIVDEMKQIHVTKSSDYGDSDPYKNLRECEHLNIPSWVGTVIRMGDKMARIKNFVKLRSLNHESIEDSLLDLATYSVIALVLYREHVVETKSNYSLASDEGD